MTAEHIWFKAIAQPKAVKTEIEKNVDFRTNTFERYPCYFLHREKKARSGPSRMEETLTNMKN